MSDPVFISGTASSSSDLNSRYRIVCRVCEKQFSQYTCPRCNIRYCSLHCYKSHSLRCTESFMRENVTEELQQMKPDDESKAKMLDILKRLHEDEEAESFDDEGADSSISEETIQKVLSGGQVSFDDLSSEEKKLFRRAIASGELSKLIRPWDPWWLKPSAKHISLSMGGNKLIQPIAEEEFGESSETDPLHDIPPGPEEPLAPVSKLTTLGPSPLLSVHLVNIIYSYCFTLRLYNGDWRADPLESADISLSVSSVLGQGAQPETLFEALLHCLEQTCSLAYRQIGDSQFGLRLLDDVVHILNLGGSCLICLLCDMRRLIQTAEKDVKSESLSKSRKRELKSKLKAAERKIYFVMCWVHEQPPEVWSSLATVVYSEKASAAEHAQASNNGLRSDKGGRRDGPLIKEVR